VVFQVSQETLRDRIGHLIAELPVVDLTVEDPPLEDILRDLFAAPATP
jgi:ABC-2 type transport system ATP-binding protein